MVPHGRRLCIYGYFEVYLVTVQLSHHSSEMF